MRTKRVIREGDGSVAPKKVTVSAPEKTIHKLEEALAFKDKQLAALLKEIEELRKMNEVLHNNNLFQRSRAKAVLGITIGQLENTKNMLEVELKTEVKYGN